MCWSEADKVIHELPTLPKRDPDRVDKGLIVEEALTAWLKKKGY